MPISRADPGEDYGDEIRLKMQAQELGRVEKESRGVLGNIRLVAESYPDLKTSQATINSMNAIRELEDEIARHRYTYNNIVQEFNTMRDTFLPLDSCLHAQARLPQLRGG